MVQRKVARHERSFCGAFLRDAPDFLTWVFRFYTLAGKTNLPLSAAVGVIDQQLVSETFSWGKIFGSMFYSWENL